MPVGKSVVKARVTEQVVPRVRLCAACHSLHLEESSWNGKKAYVCQRCGYVTGLPVEKTVQAVQRQMRKRRLHAHHSYHAKRHHEHSSFITFLEQFHMRMWSRIMSTIVLATGLVLLSSAESFSGALFMIIGIVGLYVSTSL